MEKIVITKEMKISELMALFPEAADVLSGYGLSCASCSLSALDTLGDVCAIHHFDEESFRLLLEDLEDVVRTRSSRSADLTLTETAARAIHAIAKSEGREGRGLLIGVDADGGFSMDFQESPPEGGRIFSHPSVPEVRVFVAPVTLARIGGGAVDFRNGEFHLDLPKEIGENDQIPMTNDQ